MYIVLEILFAFVFMKSTHTSGREERREREKSFDLMNEIRYQETEALMEVKKKKKKTFFSSSFLSNFITLFYLKKIFIH